MSIPLIKEKQKIALFISLKRQYEKSGAEFMTPNEHETLWDLQDYFWQKNGGKFAVWGKVKRFQK